MYNKNTILSAIGVLLIILVFQLPFFDALAQNEIVFYSSDKFEITEHNSTINFSSEGSYEMASLNNSVWKFVNFQLNDGFRLDTFSVSAIDSNVSILSMQAFDDGLGAFLSYTVVGVGEQTFNFGIDAVGGTWSVTLDDVFVAENSGWRILPDNTLSITGIASNVTLLYFVFPDFFGGNVDSSDNSFFEQHSVSILMTVIVIIVIVMAIALRYVNQKTSNKKPL
ncbi:hypothetical protein MUO66_03520 [Candidatus Bathyarchaeota archaeon]|nr:hypothetical protein [Candidatus Bathyarchaeota archaeon]